MKILLSTASKACLALALGSFLSSFFFSFFSQQAEDRASIKIKPCDILDF
jgi:hypothetical protein